MNFGYCPRCHERITDAPCKAAPVTSAKVEHDWYGCDTGCEGTSLYLDGDEDCRLFTFDSCCECHPGEIGAMLRHLGNPPTDWSEAPHGH